MNQGQFEPNPAAAISRLIKHECGADIEPDIIKSLFLKRWSTLSDLAHALHNQLHD